MSTSENNDNTVEQASPTEISSVTPPTQEGDNQDSEQPIPLKGLLETVLNEMLGVGPLRTPNPPNCDDDDLLDTDDDDDDDDDDERWVALRKLLDSHLHVTEAFLHLLHYEE